MAPGKKRKLSKALSSFQKQRQDQNSNSASIQKKNNKTKDIPTTSVKSQLYVPIHIFENLEGCPRVLLPYTPNSKILIVGDGNFSFSDSLAGIFGTGQNITATVLETKEVLLEKYPDAIGHIQSLQESFNAKILYEIDATKLEKHFANSPLFSKIIFNFPHSGAGIKDMDRNILHHQKLLKSFFESAKKVLISSFDKRNFSGSSSSLSSYSYKTTMIPKNLAESLPQAIPFIDGAPIDTLGEIHVTLRIGDPYDQWNIKKIANSVGFVCKDAFEFIPERYPQYCHRKTIGSFSNEIEGNGDIVVVKNQMLQNKKCKTFVFVTKEQYDAMTAQVNKQIKESHVDV